MTTTMRIAVVPGDGIGVEVTAEAVRALRAVRRRRGRRCISPQFDWGADTYLKTGVTLPDGALDDAAATEFDAILLGAHGRSARARQPPRRRHPARHALPARPLRQLPPGEAVPRAPLPAEGLRRRRTWTSWCSARTPRACTSMMGGNFKKGTADEVATDSRPQHPQGRRAHHPPRLRVRSARAAATEVAMADKSNVLIHAHELWQRAFSEVAAEYPGDRGAPPATSTTLPCRWCASRRSSQVIVTTNMFGDIVTDLGGRPAGRPGHGGLRQHPSRPPQPVRARARLVAAASPGKNVANPMGAILTAGLMLEHLGWQRGGAAHRGRGALGGGANGRTTATSAAPSARAKSARAIVEAAPCDEPA